MNSVLNSMYKADIVGFSRERLEFFPDPVQTAILAANPRHCILNCSRQWGKSTITSIKALHTALFHPGSVTLVLSPSERQSGEFIHKVRELLPKVGIKPRGDGQNAASVLLPNKSRIIGLPAKESNIRGFSAVSLVLIDEASRVPDELYQCVRPMLAVSQGSLWLISTPNGRRGFFFQEWDSNKPEWTRVSVTAHQCPRISPQFLESERNALSEMFFRQEYLCEFHDEGGQLISGGIIDRSMSDAIQPLPFDLHPLHVLPIAPSPHLAGWPDHRTRHKFYIGIDFGRKMDYAAIAILEKSHWFTGPPNHWDYERKSDFRFAIRHLERFPLNTMYTEIATRIGRLVRNFHPGDEVCLIADATGVGDVAVELIRSLQLGRMFYPVIITAGDQETSNGSTYYVPKRDLIMKLVVQFEEGSFKIASMLPLAPTLREELAGLSTRFSNAGNELIATWRRDRHDDLVFAVALANWAARRDKWKGETRAPPR